MKAKRTKKLARAIEIIERVGIVLVYPIDNRPDPPSLWSELHPKSKMSWAWDSEADDRVVDLWHLREQLASSGEVAYAKWFRGRATFFSLPVFHAMLAALASAGDPESGLPPEAFVILEALRERSPQSTKELRADVGLRGREHERAFTNAMKALWARLLVVGTGEIPDGAFPSLAVSATDMMFEDLWAARKSPPTGAKEKLNEVLHSFRKFDAEFGRSWRAIHDAEKQRASRAAPGPRGRAVLRGRDAEEKEHGPGISMRDEALREREGEKTRERDPQD